MTPKEALERASMALDKADDAALHAATANVHVAIADRWIAIATTQHMFDHDPTNVGNYPVPGGMDRLEDGR